MDKKQWQKPGLIVLVRNKPEEVVLLTCKTATGGGAFGHDLRCGDEFTVPGTCIDCFAAGTT